MMTLERATQRARRLATVAVLALGAACGSDTLAPFQPEIGNAPDNLQFQVTDLSSVTTSTEYEWQNAGAAADVNQSAALSDGAALLVIRDAQGTEVYRRSLGENGTFQTASGSAGLWRVRVEFTRASGTVNFRVQRR